MSFVSLPARPFFHDGGAMMRGAYLSVSCGGSGGMGEDVTSSIAFEPWVSLEPPNEWVVTASNGLIGRIGGYDPTTDDPRETKNDWVMSYELDPALETHVWPKRWPIDDEQLSKEERQLLIGTPPGGMYALKLGILGPMRWRCFFGDKIEEADYQEAAGGWREDFSPTGPIPVSLKIITGRGNLFKVQHFDFDLSVPNMQPRCDIYANFPEFFTALSAPDTGLIPTGAASQYERATFLIDPHGGAIRSMRAADQPWGIGP